MKEEGKDKKIKIIYLKLHLWSEANLHDHWSKKNNRRLFQQNLVAQKWYTEGVDVKRPVHITLIRMAPRELDYDNLVTAFKAIRDRVAALIIPGLKPGRADNKKGITFEYGQEKNKQYLVKIKIEQLEKEDKEKKTSS